MHVQVLDLYDVVVLGWCSRLGFLCCVTNYRYWANVLGFESKNQIHGPTRTTLVNVVAM